MKNSLDDELRSILARFFNDSSYLTIRASDDIKKLFNYSDIKPLRERKNDFREELRPYIATCGEPMIVNFFEYWSESSLKGRLMRKEKQPTWETKRRLNMWVENQKKFSIAGIIAKRNNS